MGQSVFVVVEVTEEGSRDANVDIEVWPNTYKSREAAEKAVIYNVGDTEEDKFQPLGDGTNEWRLTMDESWYFVVRKTHLV